jgi:hypothetical protein
MNKEFEEIFEGIIKRKWRNQRNWWEPKRGLCWNIKIFNSARIRQDGTGGEEKVLSKYNKLWEYIAGYDRKESYLDFITGQSWNMWKETQEENFMLVGRSGGWLYIEKFQDRDLETFFFHTDLRDEDGDHFLRWIKELDSLCNEIDNTNFVNIWNADCNYERYTMEQQWEEKDFSFFSDSEIDTIIKSDISEGFRSDLIKYQINNKKKDLIRLQYSLAMEETS